MWEGEHRGAAEKPVFSKVLRGVEFVKKLSKMLDKEN
jgi:hypothetical protein